MPSNDTLALIEVLSVTKATAPASDQAKMCLNHKAEAGLVGFPMVGVAEALAED